MSELLNDTYNKIQPKRDKWSWAQRLLKLDKMFENSLSLHPMIDTTCAKHHSVGIYFTEVLNSLTQNVYYLKDSLHTAT